MPWYLGVLLTVFVPLVILNTYVGVKVSRALTGAFALRPRRTALSIAGILVLLNSLPIVAFITYGVAGRPAMDAFAGENQLVDLILVYPFWATLVVIVQLAILLFIWDIIRFIAVKALKRPAAVLANANRKLTLGLAAAVILITLPTLYVQTNIPRINEQTIPIPSRFSDLDGLRILHISDVQGDGRTDKAQVEEFVRIGNELAPDLVMNSGDIVTTGDAYIDQTAEALGELRAPIGKFAAVGDHDIFSGNKQKVLQAVRAADHTMLEDTSIYMAYRQTTIGLTFVTYTYRQRPSDAALDTLLSLPDSVYRILLVHQPAMSLMERAVSREYDLVLAGHTHGGGVAFGLPGLGFLAPASFETRYVSGLFHEGSTYINVTTGLGFTLAPVRFNAPIEMSLLTLRAEIEERHE